MDDLTDLGNALPDVDAKKGFSELVGLISRDDFNSSTALRDALKEQGHDNPSKGLMKALARELKIMNCGCCEFVADDQSELAKHLKSKNHVYGQNTYAKNKRDLLERVRKTHIDKGLDVSMLPVTNPDVSSSVPSKRGLTTMEITAWNSLDHNTDLTGGERQTFYRLVHTGLMLMEMKKHLRRI